VVGFVEGKAPRLFYGQPPAVRSSRALHPIDGGRRDRRERVDESAEVGIGGVQMSSHAGNEERAGIVLACGYRGIINYRIGIKEKGFADRDGLGGIPTAGSSLFGTTHAGMIAAHVNSKTKEEEEEKSNALYDISAMGGVKLNIILFTIWSLIHLPFGHLLFTIYFLRCKITTNSAHMQAFGYFYKNINIDKPF